MGAPRPDPFITSEQWKVVFHPDNSLLEWIRANILSIDGEIYNPDHAHLIDAEIGFLWTNQQNTKKGKLVIGMAEEAVFRCGKWQKARQELQIQEWFGDIPDFIITLDANYCADCSDSELLSLIEHELYHCAQATDDFGMPKFNSDTGRPMYTMAGHDVEEFIGVVRRYGVGRSDGALAKLVGVANRAPEVSSDRISHACGSCI